MPRFKVLQRYEAAGVGPFDTGTTVELTDAEAAWVERDSPGTLEAVHVEPKTGPMLRPGSRQLPPTPNRQHKGGPNRSEKG